MLLANLTVRFNLSNCAGLINFTLMLNETWFFFLRYSPKTARTCKDEQDEPVDWRSKPVDSTRLLVSHPCPHGMPTYSASLFITSCGVELCLLLVKYYVCWVGLIDWGSWSDMVYPTAPTSYPCSQLVSFPEYWHKTSSQCFLHMCSQKWEWAATFKC